MIIWSLFDSGYGCYSQVFSKKEGVLNFSIGMDKEYGTSDHIEIDLSDLSGYFGKSEMIAKLETLPKPDVIIASPPCESWSVASAMPAGNACWKHTKGNHFTIRESADYETVQFKQEKSFYNRMNGELTVFNLVKIIRHFKPAVFIIENPAYGKIWEYITRVLDFDLPFENLTYYNNYGFAIKKPTRFSSNIDLHLRKEKLPNKYAFNKASRKGGSYNVRSNIPLPLIEDIYIQLENHFKEVVL
ncbi:hypothetical protein EG103P2_00012 [Enterococcus phage EG103P2]|nr:hypothetical protein EG103P1_00094 [Enterococcus phage EG103P1]WAX15577.1 hypothetical protein EG103P2_00012 [Enterococcus phage EG103P2]